MGFTARSDPDRCSVAAPTLAVIAESRGDHWTIRCERRWGCRACDVFQINRPTDADFAFAGPDACFPIFQQAHASTAIGGANLYLVGQTASDYFSACLQLSESGIVAELYCRPGEGKPVALVWPIQTTSLVRNEPASSTATEFRDSTSEHWFRALAPAQLRPATTDRVHLVLSSPCDQVASANRLAFEYVRTQPASR